MRRAVAIRVRNKRNEIRNYLFSGDFSRLCGKRSAGAEHGELDIGAAAGGEAAIRERSHDGEPDAENG